MPRALVDLLPSWPPWVARRRLLRFLCDRRRRIMVRSAFRHGSACNNSPCSPGSSSPTATRAVSVALATNLQPSRAILASMGIRPDDVEKAMRSLRRRNPLLDAWLDALNRLDGPDCRIDANPRTSPPRRILLPSVERHRTGRRSPHLVVVHRPSF
jgi:hypothetical protein